MIKKFYFVRKKDFKKAQEYFFNLGFVWNSSGRNIIDNLFDDDVYIKTTERKTMLYNNNRNVLHIRETDFVKELCFNKLELE